MAVIDYLTCGGCQTEFPLHNIVTFINHKKVDCSLPEENYTQPIGEDFSNYSCYTCPKKFGAAVSLLHHAQYQHKLNIFRETMSNHYRKAIEMPHAVDILQQAADVMRRKPHDDPPNGNKEEDVDPRMPIESQVATSAHAVIDNDITSEVDGPLSKCCTSVVPKKRKRHFEMKHRNSFFKNSRLKRQAAPQQIPSSDINIYLDPAVLNSPPPSTREGDDIPRNSGSEGDSQGVLLQPGGSVTIPFSDSGGGGNYFGISYADSPTSSSTTPLDTRTTSPTSSEKTLSAEAAQESTSSVTNENIPENPGSASSRKKYPTSKPFKCDHCGDSFNQRIHLKKHLSKHTGVKPYKCGQCDYATVERSHLKVHIRIHTGEKPFKCTHCEYATAQNSTLKIHLKRHHGGSLSLECTHCGKFFPERKQLLSHKQEHKTGGASGSVSDIKPPVSTATEADTAATPTTAGSSYSKPLTTKRWPPLLGNTL